MNAVSVSIPLLLSGAHLHPTKWMIAELFGDHPLTIKRQLTLRGNWVYNERVLVSGEPDGITVSVAVLGPFREEAQLELNPSQARMLKIPAPWRQSGDLDRSPGFWVAGPAGRVHVPRGAIFANAHIHLPLSWGALKRLAASTKGADGRWTWYDDLPVKLGDWDAPEIHFDSEVGRFLFGGATTAVVATRQAA